MLNHYSWNKTPEGYEFTTLHGLNYLVYFTDFFLDDYLNDEPLRVSSVGITCKTGNRFNINKKDGLIRETIIEIILNFFENKPKESVLYFCMTDGSQRERKITFGRWFYEINDLAYEKHDSDIKYSLDGIFATILIRSDHNKKEIYINSFHYTLNKWFGIIKEE